MPVQSEFIGNQFGEAIEIRRLQRTALAVQNGMDLHHFLCRKAQPAASYVRIGPEPIASAVEQGIVAGQTSLVVLETTGFDDGSSHSKQHGDTPINGLQVQVAD
ncbi:hypothetical protein Sa4125_34340 [Aureimonas sp. SA4125]|nr:hypothetical protein Sa4125_34340 [Aureimonas sp. SA4125]